MRTFLILSLITVGLSFGVSQIASAVCMDDGDTPEGGNIINCPAPVQNGPLTTGTVPNTTNLADEVNVPAGGGIDIPLGSAIDTAEGNDIVTVDGGTLIANTQAIDTDDGDDTVIVNSGTIVSRLVQAIQAPNDNNTITVNGGLLTAGNEVIQTGGGIDKITINGGTFISDDDHIINSGGGNDMVTLNGGIYIKGIDEAIDLGSGNDILTFGADIDLDGGFVECGDGFDTLVFAMEVPEEAVGFISSQILGSNPAGDSVVINDITYEWQNCELLVPDLNGVRVVRPIPTLSEWGLIAMAGVLGIVGLLAVRRKTISA